MDKLTSETKLLLEKTLNENVTLRKLLDEVYSSDSSTLFIREDISKTKIKEWMLCFIIKGFSDEKWLYSIPKLFDTFQMLKATILTAREFAEQEIKNTSQDHSSELNTRLIIDFRKEMDFTALNIKKEELQFIQHLNHGKIKKQLIFPETLRMTRALQITSNSQDFIQFAMENWWYLRQVDTNSTDVQIEIDNLRQENLTNKGEFWFKQEVSKQIFRNYVFIRDAHRYKEIQKQKFIYVINKFKITFSSQARFVLCKDCNLAYSGYHQMTICNEVKNSSK